MKRLKEILCFWAFAGHNFDIIDAGIVRCDVRCRRCGKVSYY